MNVIAHVAVNVNVMSHTRGRWVRTHVIGQQVIGAFDRIRREEKKKAQEAKLKAALRKKKLEFEERQKVAVSG